MLRLLPQRDPWLQEINEKIVELASDKPRGSDLYNAFSLAARLASGAIETGAELQHLAGINPRALKDALNFWHRLRDYNGNAALNCMGGNQTLAEALVTFQLMRSRSEDQEGDRKPVQTSAKDPARMPAAKGGRP
jgi:hypothetical protein